MSWDKFLLLGPLTDRAIKRYALRGWYGPKVKAQYDAKDEAKRRARFLFLERRKKQKEKKEVKKEVKNLKKRLDEWEKGLM